MTNERALSRKGFVLVLLVNLELFHSIGNVLSMGNVYGYLFFTV